MNEQSGSTAESRLSNTILYCPHCDYNLTGLSENRCPECGRLFDVAQMQVAREQTDEEVPPLTILAAVLHFCWPHVLVALVVAAGLAELGFLVFLVVLSGGPISSLMISSNIAERARRTVQPFSMARWRGPVIGLWLLLAVLQLLTEVVVLVVLSFLQFRL